MTDAGGADNLWDAGLRSHPLSQQVYLNLTRVHEALQAGVNKLCKSYGLSPFQYNVLRILRGAGPEGLPSRAIGDRMLHRVPDITRLIDRLEAAGLVVRRRSTTDRRVVRVCLARKALELLASIDSPLLALHEEYLRHLAEDELDQLNRMLLKLQQGIAAS